MPPRATPQAPLRSTPLRRAPLFLAALTFAAGIALARVTLQETSLLVSALILLLALTLAALRFAPRAAIPAALGLWTVLGLAAFTWQPAPAAAPVLTRLADGLSRTVRGTVTRIRLPPSEEQRSDTPDAIQPWNQTEDTSRQHGRPILLDLQVTEMEDVTPDSASMVPASGGIRVAVYDEQGSGLAALQCGARLELPLRLRTPETYRTPGTFQAADYLITQGIYAQGNASVEDVALLGQAPPTARCRLLAVQNWAALRLDRFVQSTPNRRLPRLLRLNPDDAAMLNAMLFGDRSGLSHQLRLGFERTGSFHLFVVSGLHVALLAAGVFWLTRRLHAPNWLATLLTLIAAASYALLTGFGQPAQRALITTAVFLSARLLNRQGDLLNALGAAILVMLALDPRSLFGASLQMTVLAIVAIGGIAVPLGRHTFLRLANAARPGNRWSRRHLTRQEQQFRFHLDLWADLSEQVLGPRARNLPASLVRGLLWTAELALTGLVAELVMVLPMALYFHRATVFALPANLLVIPLIGLLLPAALLTFVLALGSPWLALLPGAATALLLHAVNAGIHTVSSLRTADVRVPGPVWWVALLALAIWLFCCWMMRQPAARSWRVWVPVALLPLTALMLLWPAPAVHTTGSLEVTAIDVGQGDSILTVLPSGKTILIDAGGPVGRGGQAEMVSNFDVGEEVVSPYLWSRHIRRLDVLVLTHAHTDHMGGMPAILRNFHPRQLWVGSDPHSLLYQQVIVQAAALGIVVRHVHAGQSQMLDGVAIDVLAPAAGYLNASAPRNDDSVVLSLRYGKASVLLEGDAERPSEDTMLAAGVVHPVTLLKVGHHGSKTSSNPEFLAAAQPRLAVISVGRRNTFGHPRADVIQRLADEGTHVFRTDRFGLTTFFLTPDGKAREQIDGRMLGQR